MIKIYNKFEFMLSMIFFALFFYISYWVFVRDLLIVGPFLFSILPSVISLGFAFDKDLDKRFVVVKE